MPRLMVAPELPRIVKSFKEGSDDALRYYNYLGEINYFDVACIYGIVTSEIKVLARVDGEDEVACQPARTGALVTNAGTFLTAHSSEELGMVVFPED
jgi:hypothetical protein